MYDDRKQTSQNRRSSGHLKKCFNIILINKNFEQIVT